MHSVYYLSFRDALLLSALLNNSVFLRETIWDKHSSYGLVLSPKEIFDEGICRCIFFLWNNTHFRKTTYNTERNSWSYAACLHCLALYSKAKDSTFAWPFPYIPRVIPEKVQKAAINMVKLCIQHTGLLAGRNVHTDQGIVQEPMLTIDLEVTPPQTDDEKLQQQVIISQERS